MNLLRPVVGGASPWPWLWFTVAAALGILLWWRAGAPAPAADVRVVEHEVTRLVPIEKIRVEKQTDTVIDIRLVKDATDRYFLGKRMREVDSLRALIREYAAERGDSVEQIACADTVICHDSGCDTVSVQFLSLANIFRVSLAPAPRQVQVLERSVFVDKEVMPFAAKLEWGGYGILVGALGTYVATRER